nr:hypothetical protein Iba_chr13bCG4660 [Ipomoea batatas]
MNGLVGCVSAWYPLRTPEIRIAVEKIKSECYSWEIYHSAEAFDAAQLPVPTYGAQGAPDIDPELKELLGAGASGSSQPGLPKIIFEKETLRLKVRCGGMLLPLFPNLDGGSPLVASTGAELFLRCQLNCYRMGKGNTITQATVRDQENQLDLAENKYPIWTPNSIPWGQYPKFPGTSFVEMPLLILYLDHPRVPSLFVCFKCPSEDAAIPLFHMFREDPVISTMIRKAKSLLPFSFPATPTKERYDRQRVASRRDGGYEPRLQAWFYPSARMHRPLRQSNAEMEEVPPSLIQIYGPVVWFCVNVASDADGAVRDLRIDSTLEIEAGHFFPSTFMLPRSPSFPVAKLVVLSSLLQVKKHSRWGCTVDFTWRMVVALGGRVAEEWQLPAT